MHSNSCPIVALIGRPNVGKSTLFNRITRRRDAIVDPTPGVTRDRHYARSSWEEHAFILIDTGGIEEADGPDSDEFSDHIRNQAAQAMEEADVILLLLDGRQGVMPGDHELMKLLRRTDKEIFFAVNKIDAPDREVDLLTPFWELGVEQLWPLSGDHGYGFRTLMDALVKKLSKAEAPEGLPDGTIRLSFLGRPNVGKSSIINAIVGRERMVVSDVSGTTRDSVDTLLSRDQYNYLLIDTAGIRRKGKTKDKLEKFSILKALKSLGRCDISAVLIDAEEGITEQDTKIIGYTQEYGRALLILINKWDLITGDKRKQDWLLEEVRLATNFIPFVPVFRVSAKTGYGIKRIFPEIGKMHRQFYQRFSTSSLNRLLEVATAHHEPPMYRGRRLKLYYTAQISAAPPSFAVIANAPKGIHFSYQRYLINRFREGLGLDRVPVRVVFRERSGRTTNR